MSKRDIENQNAPQTDELTETEKEPVSETSPDKDNTDNTQDDIKDVSAPEEKYGTDELDSLIEAEKLDDIAEYYADKTDDSDIVDESSLDGATLSEDGDEDIHDSAQGLSEKKKLIISYCISILISLCVVAAAFVCALNMPKNEEILNAAAEELRGSDEYTALRSQLDALTAEVEELRSNAEEKKNIADGLSDSENTKAALNGQIREKRQELDSINAQNSELEQQINELNKQIAASGVSSVTLPAGRYTAGTHIAPGKYNVTGTGKITVASSDGEQRSESSGIIGSTVTTVTLEDGDKIDIDSKTTFTIAN